MAKKSARQELAEAAAAANKLWEKLGGSEKDKPQYEPANQLAALCTAIAETVTDLDANWKVVKAWQGGAEPDGTDDSPEVVVKEFRFQFLEDAAKMSVALRQALKCVELAGSGGFEAAFTATNEVAAGAWNALASIKMDDQ